jgi:hypothetical protein
MSGIKLEYIQLIQKLKDSSTECYDSFVENIINEEENINKIESVVTRNDSKHLINLIKSQTIFDSFYINNWNDFINKVKLNKMVRDNINSSLMPTNRKLFLLQEVFKHCFQTSLTSSVLHFFTTCNDQYVMFLISNFIKQSNKSIITIGRKFHLSENEMGLIKIFIKSKKIKDEIYEKEYQKLMIPSFKTSTQNTNRWKITRNPYFYKNTLILPIAELYDGMGFYIMLVASLAAEDKYKPYFFILEGGSDYTEAERNKNFYENNKPPKHKMYNLKSIIDFIEQATFRPQIFTY